MKLYYFFVVSSWFSLLWIERHSIKTFQIQGFLNIHIPNQTASRLVDAVVTFSKAPAAAPVPNRSMTRESQDIVRCKQRDRSLIFSCCCSSSVGAALKWPPVDGTWLELLAQLYKGQL